MKVVVVGLDSIPPDLIFDRFQSVMPNIARLRTKGVWGALRTCEPPITVPAWAVMFTGMDPGTLGIFGFRHRRPGTYFDTYSPTPTTLRHPPLWEILSRRGLKVGVIGMPPGYPPPPVNGVSTGDFLTPDGVRDSVYPPGLLPVYEKALGGPLKFDVTFRSEERDRVLKEIFELTRQRWALAREAYRGGKYELFAVHDIGPDRFHHAFWKFFDTGHPRFVKGNPYEAEGARYYAMLDEEVGKFLEVVDPESVVLLASDHGSKAMHGCFCINEWLIQKGYLTLAKPPAPGAPLEKCAIDWKRTKVWGAGGYYARLFLNVKGREPQGIVSPKDVPALTQKLVAELSQAPGPNGAPLGTRVITPAQVYRTVVGDAPDLMAYFADLDWRSAGTVGHGTLHLFENDTGPDDSVHGWDGFYLLLDPRRPASSAGPGPRQEIIDVAPTLLRIMGHPVPPHMQGKPVAGWLPPSTP